MIGCCLTPCKQYFHCIHNKTLLVLIRRLPFLNKDINLRLLYKAFVFLVVFFIKLHFNNFPPTWYGFEIISYNRNKTIRDHFSNCCSVMVVSCSYSWYNLLFSSDIVFRSANMEHAAIFLLHMNHPCIP